MSRGRANHGRIAMSTINRVPKGLLGTLDSKTLGRTPGELLPDVRGVYDLTPNYLADIPMGGVIDINAAVNPVGIANTIEVPAGELWAVYNVALKVTLLNVGAPLFSIQFRAIDGSQHTLASYDRGAGGPAGVGDGIACFLKWDSPFYASSGSQFLGFNDRLVVGESFNLAVLRRVIQI